MVSKKLQERTESLVLRIIWKLPHAVPFVGLLVSWVAAVEIAGNEPHEFGLLSPAALWFLGLLFPVAFGLGLITVATVIFAEWLVNTRRLNRERKGGHLE